MEALTSVASLLHQTADASSEGVRDQSSEFGHDLERLVPKLAECIEDSHHKVCVCVGGGVREGGACYIDQGSAWSPS